MKAIGRSDLIKSSTSCKQTVLFSCPEHYRKINYIRNQTKQLNSSKLKKTEEIKKTGSMFY